MPNWVDTAMTECFGPVYARGDYAGFIRRTVALVFDAALLIGARLALLWGWYLLAPAPWVTDRAYVWLDCAWLVAAAIYFFGFRFTMRGTPGYRLVGIQYAYMLDGKPPLPWVVLRSLLAGFLMCVFALDHIWIIFDERKQAWHDKVSGFYVVKRTARPLGTQKVVQRVINFMMLTFVVWEPAGSTESDCELDADPD